MADNFELYRQAVFLIGEGRVDWGADFAVITAFNPDGRAPAIEQEGASGKLDDWIKREQERLNQDAHLRLKADLLRLTKPRWLPDFLLPACTFLLRDRLAAVTGCSPDLVHREPGWAANITLSEALRLGRLYRQDAIFWVSGGALYLVDARAPQGAQGLGGTGALGKTAARRFSGTAARETPGMELLGPWSERVR